MRTPSPSSNQTIGRTHSENSIVFLDHTLSHPSNNFTPTPTSAPLQNQRLHHSTSNPSKLSKRDSANLEKSKKQKRQRERGNKYNELNSAISTSPSKEPCSSFPSPIPLSLNLSTTSSFSSASTATTSSTPNSPSHANATKDPNAQEGFVSYFHSHCSVNDSPTVPFTSNAPLSLPSNPPNRPNRDFQKNKEEGFKDKRDRAQTGRTVDEAFRDCWNGVKKHKLIMSNMNLNSKTLPTTMILTSFQSTLHKLNLSNNPIYNIPQTLVTGLYNLHNLDFSQCEIRTLEDTKWDLPNLRKFNLSGNKIDSFPVNSFLCNLPSLTDLNLFSNNISFLDFTDVLLPNPFNLQILNLGYNNLQSFPLGLELITSLKSVYINNNYVETVPPRVVKIPNLSTLNINQNPISQPPPETCERGLEAMRRYYRCMEGGTTKGSRDSKSQLTSTTVKGGGRLLHDRERIRMEENSGKPVSLFPKKEKRKGKGKGGGKGGGERLSRSRSEGRRSSGSYPKISNAAAAPAEFIAKSISPTPNMRSISQTAPVGVAASAAGAVSPPPPPSAPSDSTSGHPSPLVPTPVPVLRGLSAPVQPTPPPPLTTTTTKPISHEAFTKLMTVAAGGEKSPPHPKLKITNNETRGEAKTAVSNPSQPPPPTSINNTLKVIFVGDSLSGKTSIISRLKYGRKLYPGVIRSQKPNGNYIITFDDGKKSVETKRDAIVKQGPGVDSLNGTKIPLRPGDKVKARRDVVPKMDNRTIGVEITTWKPEQEYMGSQELEFSVWDFAGQTAYHATHELYFSPRALYVLCWDMGAANEDLFLPSEPNLGAVEARSSKDDEDGDFDFDDFESDDDDEAVIMSNYEKEKEKSVRKLKSVIDDRCQFWVDCIQTSVPGAVILPVATFDDYFDPRNDKGEEARRRCRLMVERLQEVEAMRVKELQEKLLVKQREGKLGTTKAMYLRDLLHLRPKLMFPEDGEEIIRVSCDWQKEGMNGRDNDNGFGLLRDKLIRLTRAKSRDTGYPLFTSIGSTIPPDWEQVRSLIKTLRKTNPFIDFKNFLKESKDRNINPSFLSDALHFFSDVGIILYFGSDSALRSNQLMVKNRNMSKIDWYFEEDEDEEDAESGRMTGANSMSTFEDESEGEVAGTTRESHSASTSTVNTVGRNNSTNSNAADVSQFIFLNPIWLMTACKGILRHDLKGALKMIDNDVRGGFFLKNDCPVITRDEALALWRQSNGSVDKSFVKWVKGTENIIKANGGKSPFIFLIKLLVTFNVFVPVDFTIKQTILGGVRINDLEAPDDEDVNVSGEGGVQDISSMSHNYFLPSLLNEYAGPQHELFEFKSTSENERDYHICLAHSFVLNDFKPPGIMSRIIAFMLRDVHERPTFEKGGVKYCLELIQIICYSSQTLLVLRTRRELDGADVGSVKVYVTMLDAEIDCHQIGGDFLKAGNKRLVVAARGFKSDGGESIWRGGFELVLEAVGRVLKEYSGLEYQSEIFCYKCIEGEQSTQLFMVQGWLKEDVQRSLKEGKEKIMCNCGKHNVDMCYLLPEAAKVLDEKRRREKVVMKYKEEEEMKRSVFGNADLFPGVVYILVLSKGGRVQSIGSGFVVGKKGGLIMTAAHVMYDMRSGKLVGSNDSNIYIGLIEGRERRAVFRYGANIVESNLSCDCCMLKISSKLRRGVKEVEWLKEASSMMLEQGELDRDLIELEISDRGREGIDLGTEVILLGFPRRQDDGMCLSMMKGMVDSIGKQICFQVPNYGGNSGGPIVGNDGKVIGVLSKGEMFSGTTAYGYGAWDFLGMVKRVKGGGMDGMDRFLKQYYEGRKGL